MRSLGLHLKTNCSEFRNNHYG